MKNHALFLLALLCGLTTGMALGKSSPEADTHPLDGCTLEQRAQVRLASAEYVIEGSHPVEALMRARAEFCK